MRSCHAMLAIGYSVSGMGRWVIMSGIGFLIPKRKA